MHQLFSSTDIAVHYLSPFLVVMDMILFDKNQDYSWYIPFQWLLIPIIYFFYIVGRTFFHRPVPEPEHPYLYFFLDITDIGITLIFLVAGYFVLIINQIKAHLH